MDPEQIPLRDLHLPDAVGWWPPAPGWWLLFALALAGLLYLMYRQVLKWRRNAARRIALAELGRLRHEYEQGTDALTLARALSELLRRSMLAYAPRSEVAGLTGNSWLEWLDQGLDDRPFSEGAGKSLESLPYRSPQSVGEDADLSGLIEAVKKRLMTPLAEDVA